MQTQNGLFGPNALPRHDFCHKKVFQNGPTIVKIEINILQISDKFQKSFVYEGYLNEFGLKFIKNLINFRIRIL